MNGIVQGTINSQNQVSLEITSIVPLNTVNIYLSYTLVVVVVYISVVVRKFH